jgi:protein-S-isoprenylcysteine O-methyltransferase Ste14
VTLHSPPPQKDSPDVVVRPPVLFAVLLVLGIVLHRLWPIRLPHNWPWREQWPGGDETLLLVVGLVTMALAFLCAGTAIVQFFRAHTNIPTNRPASALVTDGIYRFTRNPIYVGFILLQVSLGLLFENWWLVILLVPLIAVLRYGVVAREEAYLERKFGQAYLDYKASVRRWF